MSTLHWLRADECSLLRPELDSEDDGSSRQLQRLLELALVHSDERDLPNELLEEICSALRADSAVVLQASPEWPTRWRFQRRGARSNNGQPPRQLLSDVLDRMAGSRQSPGASAPAHVAAIVGGDTQDHGVLLISRVRDEFTDQELEYTVAAAHYLGVAITRATDAAIREETRERLETLVDIGRQLVEQPDTVALLEHIAEQACRLLRCERTSIFLLDEERGELVGRPALGLPGGELRIAADTGVVGRVVQSGQPAQVDDVQESSLWNPEVDSTSGFQTRNLLCLPLADSDGKIVGAFEVINKESGRFTEQDAETVEAMGRQTVAALDSVRERETLLRSNAEFEDQARQGCRIVGESTEVKQLRQTLDGLARTNLPVLILGESGTGKDVVARSIHFTSPRRSRPFIPVNCAAIAETLLESELFGHEKGAFTGADQQRSGKFEAASGGTLFLDEVGDLSAGGQAKLLRVLEEKVVYRVGGTQPIPVDVRIVAATNRDLADAVREKKFREDLFYRLSVVALKLPPLRDRQDDVIILAEHFMRQFCRDAGRRLLKFTADAKKSLRAHVWPGNVRELRNLLERVAYLCQNDKIDAADLPFIARPLSDVADDFSHLGLSEATDAFQVQHIRKAIERSGGNMSDAAKLLGLHRPNLYRKMRLLEMSEGE